MPTFWVRFITSNTRLVLVSYIVRASLTFLLHSTIHTIHIIPCWSREDNSHYCFGWGAYIWAIMYARDWAIAGWKDTILEASIYLRFSLLSPCFFFSFFFLSPCFFLLLLFFFFFFPIFLFQPGSAIGHRPRFQIPRWFSWWWSPLSSRSKKKVRWGALKVSLDYSVTKSPSGLPYQAFLVG